MASGTTYICVVHVGNDSSDSRSLKPDLRVQKNAVRLAYSATSGNVEDLKHTQQHNKLSNKTVSQSVRTNHRVLDVRCWVVLQ